MIDLDEIDARILGILQQEGKISTLELAHRVGLSATPCARRVKRMEDEGLVERYVALVNAERLGMGFNAFVNVRLKSAARHAHQIFAQAIKNMPEVVECYEVTGTYDCLLHVRVADVGIFRNVLFERLSKIPVVTETQSYIVLEQMKYTTAIAVPSGGRKFKR